MPTTLNEIPKVFQHGETLESAELNAIIQQVNSTIRKLNSVETNLENHGYDVSIPITNIYCRTKKGINAINFFPQADAKRDELLDQVSNCSTTQGIKYNTTFSTITLSENADLMNGVWTAYPQGVNESLPHEWEVSYKKLTDNSIMYMYGPVLRSNYGYSGADGDSVQYVYKTFNHLLTDIERTNNTPTRPENPDSNGEFIPSGWFDDPQGPTEEYPFEYVSTLKRINGTWGSFEKISLWSTYTEDGTNGDYYARAFCRFIPTDNKLTPNRPIGGSYENPQPGSNDNIQWSLTIPAEDNNNKGPIWTSTRIFKGNNQSTQWSIPVVEADSAELDIEYSSQVEKPDPDTTLRTIPKTANPSNIWHDPSEANIDLSTMIWRAERKIKNGQYNGNWVITKIAGQKGDFKSIVFRRFKPTTQQLVPPTPTGGIYSNPIPDGGLWHDGIPSGDIKTYGPVWASTKIFHDDGTQTNWSTPQLQSDSENLDIEFSPSENQPNDPEGEEPFSNREAQGWYDPSSSNFDSHGPMIWRAERKVQNGVYNGSWTVTRIVGEQGPEGKRGSFKSCVFRRSNSVLSNFNAINNQGEIIDGATYENPVPTGWSDGIPSGTEALWMAVSRFTGEGDSHSNWTVTQQTDNVDLDIEFSPGEGTGHTCPQISPTNINDQNDPYQIFTHPINNKDINGNKSTERSIREGLGWYDSSDLPSGTMIWRAERKINGLQQYEGDWVVTRITGEKGDSTTLTESQQQDLDSAGLQIVVTPQNIILDQSDVLTGANDDKIDDVVANIVVYDRTGAALNNNQYRIATDGVSIYATKTDGTSELLTPISNFVDITGADLINAKSVKIKNLPITTTTANGTSTYTYTYNKGYIRVILTIPVGTSTKNIKIDIPWYLNKLGERIEKLKGDISETYLSRDVFTNDHTNKTIKQEFDAYIKDSAEGRLAHYGLIQSAQGGGYEAAFDAQYIQNASENIAKLTKSVATTNLIADNGWCNSFSSTQISGKYKTSCSPFVYLKAGKYIFSTYINSNTTVNNNIKLFAKYSNTKLDPSTLLTDYSNEGWQAIAFNGILEADASTGYEGDYYPSASASPNYVRMYFVFTVEASGTFQEGYYTFHVSQNNTNFTTCIRPQLELCLDANTDEMPTAWIPGPQDFSSEIKQTADEITTQLAGPGGSLSQVKQTLTNITSTVKGIQENGENLILNGAFQDGTGGTLNWTEWGTPTTREIVEINGRKWMHIVSTIDQFQGYQQEHINDFKVRVIPGEKYTLSFRAYSASGTPEVCMGFHWKDASNSNTIVSQNWYTFQIDTTPKVYSETITIPSGVNSFNVMVGDRTTSAQNFYMTEIKFEKGEVATSWSPTRLDTYSEIKQTANGITSTVNSIDGRVTQIQQTVNEINLQAGVSEQRLNQAGLQLTAGTPADNTTNPPTPAVPSKVRIKAGQFEVFTPEDTQNNVPEKIVFGNDANTDTMVFYGDVKTGGLITNDVYDRRMNEINADGTGNLGGRLIEWDPDPTNGGLYIGPGPEDVEYNSFTIFNSGFSNAHYNGDGIRVFPDGTIHFQGEMDGDFHFGKIKIQGSDGTLECKHFDIEKTEYINGTDNTRGITTHIDKNSGMSIKLQTTDSENTIPYNGGQLFTSDKDWGSIGFGTNTILSGDIIGKNQNGGSNFNEPDFGIYVKGKDGRVYRGFTGYVDIGNNNKLYFINGIMIGTSTTEGQKAIFGSNS